MCDRRRRQFGLADQTIPGKPQSVSSFGGGLGDVRWLAWSGARRACDYSEMTDELINQRVFHICLEYQNWLSRTCIHRADLAWARAADLHGDGRVSRILHCGVILTWRLRSLQCRVLVARRWRGCEEGPR